MLPLLGVVWVDMVLHCMPVHRIWKRPSLPAMTWVGPVSIAVVSLPKPYWQHPVESEKWKMKTIWVVWVSPYKVKWHMIVKGLRIMPTTWRHASRAISKRVWLDWVWKLYKDEVSWPEQHMKSRMRILEKSILPRCVSVFCVVLCLYHLCTERCFSRTTNPSHSIYNATGRHPRTW